jgi:hypothetical protein
LLKESLINDGNVMLTCPDRLYGAGGKGVSLVNSPESQCDFLTTQRILNVSL